LAIKGIRVIFLYICDNVLNMMHSAERVVIVPTDRHCAPYTFCMLHVCYQSINQSISQLIFIVA